MTLIISELNYNEIKTINLNEYLYQGNGFFDLIKGNKNKILQRIENVIDYYRFFSNIPLNIIIITEKEWANISPKELKNSIKISCWSNVPEYADFDNRLDDSQIKWSKSDINNIINTISKIDFRQANLNVQFALN